MGTVTCPVCQCEQEFDIDNDTILCDDCNSMLIIEQDDETGEFVVEVLC